VISLLQRFGRGTLISYTAILALSFFPSGCKKSPAATSATNATPAATEAEPAAAASTAPGFDENQVKADLEDLNKLVRAYVQSTKTVPKNVQELVTSGFVRSLPSPPPGKAFAIRLHPFGYQVVLVDN
jgi:hypothetical protein